MNLELLLVLGVLLATIALFVTDWLRLDLVSLLALLALMLSGVLTPAEALAGFSDPLVLIIAGLFVVGAGLFRTGVAALLGDWLGRAAGDSQTRLLVVIMLVVALLSAFMSSTGTVAILLPVVVTLAQRAAISPSKLLIPLSFASLVGGMLTLIGTPPNIVVSNQLVALGQPPFGFFAFSPIGLVMLGLSLAFMVLVGQRLLPDRPPAGAGVEDRPDAIGATELAAGYGVAPASLHRLAVSPGSSLVGTSLAAATIRTRFGLTVVDVLPPEGGAARPRRPAGDHAGLGASAMDPTATLVAGGVLLVQGTELDTARAAVELQLERLPEEAEVELSVLGSLSMAEVLLTPRSRLIGHTLSESRFRDRFQLNVLSVLRMGKPLGPDFRDTRLRFGDALLVQGTAARIHTLGHEPGDFVVVTEARRADLAAPHFTGRMALSLTIMLGMLVLMTFDLLPGVVAVLLAAVAMVLGRCLSIEDGYRAISWESLVLIAGMLPMATALNKTGGMALVARFMTSTLGRLGASATMLGLFLLTSLFSQFISNTATTVLVAPIAARIAAGMAVSPRPFLMVVAIAASTAFATPIASPVNTLVLTPGNYRFTDYARVGVGLQLLLMVATVLLVPLLFPLGHPVGT